MVCLVSFNQEYEDLRKEVEALKEKYAERLTFYSDESTHHRKFLETRYMMTIGQREFELFSKKFEIARIRREIALYQSALNNGRQLSATTVQAILDDEFAKYKQEIEEKQKEIELAEERFLAPKLSQKKAIEMTKLYKGLLFKLHPDLNPELPEKAVELMNRIQEAFQTGNWPELMLLADLAEAFLGKKADQSQPSMNQMEALLRQKDTLKEKLATLEKRIEELQSRPPFTFQELLSDPDAILKRRAELATELEQLQQLFDSLTKIRDKLKNP